MISALSNKEIIGISGGMGSGKSVVSRILRLNGFQVYDCDVMAKQLMENDRELKSALCRILGESIYLEGVRLDRKMMAERIFSDWDLLRRVNSVVHAAVRDDFLRFVGMSSSGKVFCESAVLVSSGLAGLCSEVWIVEAPEYVRIARVKVRNGMDVREIRKRMDAQANEFAMLSGMPAVRIANNGSDPLLPMVLKLTKKEIKTEILCSEKF